MKKFAPVLAALKSILIIVFIEHMSPGWYLVNILATSLYGYLVFRRHGMTSAEFLVLALEALAPVFSTVTLLIATLSRKYVLSHFPTDPTASYHLPLGEEHYLRSLRTRRLEVLHDPLNERREARLQEALAIEPYIDIIEGHDLELKVNAIGKLSHMRTKDSIALLKRALDDADYEVRYFATNSLTLLEKQIIREIEAHDGNIERDPSDHQHYTLRGLAHLNLFYLELMDRSIGLVFLEKALNDFFYSLQLNSAQSYLYVKILEIATHQRDFERVLSVASDLKEIQFPPEEKVKIDFYVAEALYMTEDFPALLEMARKLHRSPDKAPLMTESLAFWGES